MPSADLADLANRRPIENLWSISKVTSVGATTTTTSAEFCQLLSSQFGFRTGQSTEMALLELLSNVCTVQQATMCVVLGYCCYGSRHFSRVRYHYMGFSDKDRILIENLYVLKVMEQKHKKFSNKGWGCGD